MITREKIRDVFILLSVIFAGSLFAIMLGAMTLAALSCVGLSCPTVKYTGLECLLIGWIEILSIFFLYNYFENLYFSFPEKETEKKKKGGE